MGLNHFLMIFSESRDDFRYDMHFYEIFWRFMVPEGSPWENPPKDPKKALKKAKNTIKWQKCSKMGGKWGKWFKTCFNTLITATWIDLYDKINIFNIQLILFLFLLWKAAKQSRPSLTFSGLHKPILRHFTHTNVVDLLHSVHIRLIWRMVFISKNYWNWKEVKLDIYLILKTT